MPMSDIGCAFSQILSGENAGKYELYVDNQKLDGYFTFEEVRSIISAADEQEENMAIQLCTQNCPQRQVGCQSKCATYIEGKKKLDAINEARRKERVVNSYCRDSVYKVKKNLSRTKGTLKVAGRR